MMIAIKLDYRGKPIGIEESVHNYAHCSCWLMVSGRD